MAKPFALGGATVPSCGLGDLRGVHKADKPAHGMALVLFKVCINGGILGTWIRRRNMKLSLCPLGVSGCVSLERQAILHRSLGTPSPLCSFHKVRSHLMFPALGNSQESGKVPWERTVALGRCTVWSKAEGEQKGSSLPTLSSVF